MAVARTARLLIGSQKDWVYAAELHRGRIDFGPTRGVTN